MIFDVSFYPVLIFLPIFILIILFLIGLGIAFLIKHLINKRRIKKYKESEMDRLKKENEKKKEENATLKEESKNKED